MTDTRPLPSKKTRQQVVARANRFARAATTIAAGDKIWFDAPVTVVTVIGLPDRTPPQI